MSDEENNIEEQDLWKHFIKDIVPINKKNKSQYGDNSEKPYIYRVVSDKSMEIKTDGKPSFSYNFSNDIDKNTEKRLGRGKIPIDGRLDLHGMTQNQAYDALMSFIPNAYYAGKRCVLVITGKGGWQVGNPSLVNKKVGVLKKKTPIWLSSHPLNEYILKVKPARPNHGGEGALYVLLRKNKN